MFCSKDDDEKILVLEEKFIRAVAAEDSRLADAFVERADLLQVELAMGDNATYSLKRQIDRGYKYTNKVLSVASRRDV